MPNPFYVNPMADRSQALGGLAQSIRAFGQARDAKAEQQRELEKKQKAEQRFNELKTGLQKAYDANDPDALAELAFQYPEYSQMIDNMLGLQDDREKRSPKRKIINNMYLSAMTDPENSLTHLGQGLADLYQETGEIPPELVADIGFAKKDPEAWAEKAELLYSQWNPEAYKAFRQNRDVTLPSDVRTHKYFASLDKKGKKEFLLSKRAAQMYKQGDINMMLDALEGSGDVITEKGQTPKSQAEAQQEVSEQMAQKEKLKQQAVTAEKTSTEYFDRINKIDTNMANYDEAIRLVEEEGANTGFIDSKFPSIKASSQALDNLRNRLGLDVIGSTTFGALSEAEMAMALATALPSNMDGPALADWLRERKSAQQKLRDYLEEAAIYLSKPGNTVATWAEMKRAKEGRGPADESPMGAQDTEAVKWARANRNNPKWAEKANEILRLNNQNR